MGLKDDYSENKTLLYVVVLLFAYMFHQFFVADMLRINWGYIAFRSFVGILMLMRM